MSRRVRVGLAGLGRMGGLHATNLAGRAPSLELMRVVDAVEEVARATGEQLEAEWSTDYDDLLSDADIETVVLATPTPLHAEMIERAAGAGKHVFCEKPISLDLQPTTRALEAVAAAGVKLRSASASTPTGLSAAGGSGQASWATSTTLPQLHERAPRGGRMR